MATATEIMTLCAYQEARNQPDDGVAAIGRVVDNRARLGYQCDHTTTGAIERHAQFSWCEYDDGPGGYHQVAFTSAEEQARIEHLLVQAMADKAQWARCARITEAVIAATYAGVLYARLTDETVLYFNPAACGAPPWAKPLAFVCRIGAHSFYRDIAWSAMRGAPAKATAAPKVITASAGPSHTVEIDV